MKGICQLPLIPCRADSSNKSEMVNQLLFGETYTVLEMEKEWIKIRSDIDQYEAWISRNQHSESYAKSKEVHVVSQKFAAAHSKDDSIFLPAGSMVSDDQEFEVNGTQYQFENSLFKLGNAQLEKLARSFLNTPYLWGGKSFMGIDCSGYTQVLFRCIGIHLPRDAWQQEMKGKAVLIGEQELGDLAFFVNEKDKVTHVGMILQQDQIIHASGKVRIDAFDSMGITNTETQERSHKLLSIKRYF